MKVLIATDYPIDPGSPSGGVEAVSVNLVQALAKLEGNEVHVVSFAADADASVDHRNANVTIRHLPRPRSSILRFALGRGAEAISREVGRIGPDILHAHDTYGLMTADIDCPKVFTVHGFIHGDIAVASGRFNSLRSSIWKHFETRGWKNQRNIIAISPYVREYVSRFSQARIFDIDNPISEDLFELDWDPTPGRIFSAAVICRRKNTLGLIKAVRLLAESGQEVKVVLAGAITEPDYYQRVLQYVDDHQLTDIVKLPGKITGHQVRQELIKASVFALVSREENSPMGIEEAMAIGVPVVTSNKCGMPYMVRHGETGLLVDPEDPVEIASAMERIMEAPALGTRMSRAAKAVAQERFHPGAVGVRTMSAYKEILRRSP